MTEIYTPITTAKESKQPMITSLDVAEMVGREHSKVIRDIRKTMEHLGEAKIGYTPYFLETTYENEQNGQYYPMFLLTKKGCELYSTRMTGSKGTAFAVAYIERFNEMEQKEQQPQFKLPQTKIEALRALADQLEVNEKLEAEKAQLETVVATQAPMVEGFSVLTGDTDKLYTITQIATNYGMTAVKMNNLLHKMGVQYKQSGVWKLYAKYEGNGYTATPTGQTDDGYTFKNMKWTNKGEYFLYNLLKEAGITSTSYDLMFEAIYPLSLKIA